MKSTFILILASLSLTACTSPAPVIRSEPTPVSPVPVCPPPAITVSPMNEMMLYYQHISHLSANDLAQEFQRATAADSQQDNDENRLKKVLLLSLPGTAFRNIPSAINLLNKQPFQNRDFNDFANLLAALLIENQQAIDTSADLTQKLKTEKKRSLLLQNKIDAIKAMEKHLILHDRS